jgi:hypothetical protein
MPDDDSVLRPAASPAGRGSSDARPGCPPPRGFARRVLDWALYGPPWTYVLLAVAGLAAALLVAGLRF